MKSVKRVEINPINMSVKPPEVVTNAGNRVINPTDGYIYEYVGIGWIKTREAIMEDYSNIPQLTD